MTTTGYAEGSPTLPFSPRAYREVYAATPWDRIQVIKAGVKAQEAKRIVADLRIQPSLVFKALGLSPSAVGRAARRDGVLGTAHSERLLGLAKLIGQIHLMVEEAGMLNDFSAPAWLSRWLQEPVPALGGCRPLDLMDTMEGQAQVADLIARMRSGAYS
jgi:putative toxin-antitoxin system antitoxin component (TIGR02293 family)